MVTEISCKCTGTSPTELSYVPVFKTTLAACADVMFPQKVTVPPRSGIKVNLQIAFDIPQDCKILMYPRSSLLTKYGIIQPVSVIDADYSGMPVHVPLFNLTDKPVTFEPGEAAAQIEVVPRYECKDWIRNDVKRTGGFGSTGK